MIIKNCKIISNKGFEEKDIRTDKGIIVKIEDEIRAKTGEEVIEAKGRYILPGFIDIHTHLDDTIGKYKLADDFRTGSMIAALNGITSVYNFITERTDRPLKYAIEEFKRKGEKSVVNYGFHLTPVNFSPADLDYIKRTIENGFTSFKFYTTYKNAGIFISYEDIERVVKKIKTDKTLFLIHCEDEEILSRYYCYQYSEPYDHLRYRPSEAESEAVRKILSIAETTGARFHIVHCSSKESAELIRNGRNNSKITVETCPQYLILSAEHLRKRDGHRFFCTPPLREKENMMTLRKMAQSGFFDIFTTDHAPFKR
ncbi:MAG: amidohydrolase family protein, partial [Deltaproteobacteria bacterium]|nr:amidohydrolase family protein [Deltaproteobacteria bacterium]